MKIPKIFLTFAFLLLISVSPSFVSVAHAATPILSISATGNGDNVQINVTGDANASVLLFVGSQSGVLGNINSSGTALFTIGSLASENQSIFYPSGINIASNTSVYVKTGGLNGTQSTSVSWPYVQSSSTATSTLTLSQTALLLNAGQTSTITASANYLYVLSNSQPAVANINLNANQITIAANTYGSTVANICVVGSTTNCATITITVQSASTQQLNFSQNNFSIYSGQSIPVTITGGSGVYMISNNSNSSAVQANLNGSVVTLIANSAGGSASVTVCTTDNNYCGIINVNATTVNSTAVTFSQTNPVVPIGQSTTVTIYGGTGNNFYVSTNSNPSIVQVNVNSNILTLIGSASTGTSTISVCANQGSCATLTANVSNTSTGGAISLSQSSISILAGQSSNITISGGSTPYSISSSNTANIFNGVVNGNVLTIYGVNPGSATANVCASAGCVALSITINSVTSSVNPPTFSQNNILLTIGQQSTVSIYSNGVSSGSYYVANNSSSNIASATLNGSSVVVTGTGAGTTNISVCQSGGQCGTLYVTVSGTSNTSSQLILGQTNLALTPGQTSTVYITGNGTYYISSNPNSGVASSAISGSSAIITAIGSGSDNVSICQSGGQCATLSIYVTPSENTSVVTPITNQAAYVLPRYLGYGDKGDDVLMLQQILVKQGFMLATPNGHYGSATKLAVQKFQQTHGIRQTGNVGPSTKAVLDQISASNSTSGSSATTSIKQQQISLIQQEIQQLLAQIAQVQGQ